ncbi:membrane protein [Microbacterium phage Cece]|nr:membrane protein [Microbacterium phage Cece]
MDDSKLYPIPAENGRLMFVIWRSTISITMTIFIGFLSGILNLHVVGIFAAVIVFGLPFTLWASKLEEKVEDNP